MVASARVCGCVIATFLPAGQCRLLAASITSELDAISNCATSMLCCCFRLPLLDNVDFHQCRSQRSSTAAKLSWLCCCFVVAAGLPCLPMWIGSGVVEGIEIRVSWFVS